MHIGKNNLTKHLFFSLSLSLFDQIQLKWYFCSVELRRAVLQDLVIWFWLELYLQSNLGYPKIMASESVNDKWVIIYYWLNLVCRIQWTNDGLWCWTNISVVLWVLNLEPSRIPKPYIQGPKTQVMTMTGCIYHYLPIWVWILIVLALVTSCRVCYIRTLVLDPFDSVYTQNFKSLRQILGPFSLHVRVARDGSVPRKTWQTFVAPRFEILIHAREMGIRNARDMQHLCLWNCVCSNSSPSWQ